MTPSLLEKLEKSHGVRPYTIKQYTGDAVLIPAGCAHQVRFSLQTRQMNGCSPTVQVSNAADAIKIACDFLDIPNLTKTQGLVSEFRLHRIATGSGEDVLEFYNTLWHAWCSLAEKEANVLSRANLRRPSPPAVSHISRTYDHDMHEGTP